MPRHIQTVERAAAILEVLSDRPRAGVGEIATELALSKATVHGLLRTLRSVGFVERDDETGKYRLGPALLHMGSSYLYTNELRRRALGWTDGLAARTGQAVSVGAAHDSQVLVVHHVPGSDNGWARREIGMLLPAHATAMGKVLLAHQAEMRDRVRCQELTAYTDATITDQRELDRELDRTRRQGWSIERGELVPEQVSVAVPISDRVRPGVGSLALCGPSACLLTSGIPRETLLAHLRHAARAVSRELGAANP